MWSYTRRIHMVPRGPHGARDLVLLVVEEVEMLPRERPGKSLGHTQTLDESRFEDATGVNCLSCGIRGRLGTRACNCQFHHALFYRFALVSYCHPVFFLFPFSFRLVGSPIFDNSPYRPASITESSP